MTYQVKEIFYTLQGEGANAGRPAVFCRFAGCNLWRGREEDRPTAVCRFCDTDFVGTDGPDGGRFTDAASLASTIASRWTGTVKAGAARARQLVVFTGGEPLLQLDTALIDAMHVQGFEIAVESNGTLAAPAGIDWLCVSPKAGAPLNQTSGQELKVVVPQPALSLDELATLDFEHFFLQPMDGPDAAANTQWAIAQCLRDPRWRLSVQTHKVIGIR
jgi:7-carboxy-7-deazaguanine synthase